MEEQELLRRRVFPTRSNSGLEGSRVLVHSRSARPPQAGVGYGVVAPAPGMGCCPAWCSAGPCCGSGLPTPAPHPYPLA